MPTMIPLPKDVWIIQPGDYLAVIYNGRLSDEQLCSMKAGFKEAWPDIHVVILEGDWEIKVMRPE